MHHPYQPSLFKVSYAGHQVSDPWLQLFYLSCFILKNLSYQYFMLCALYMILFNAFSLWQPRITLMNATYARAGGRKVIMEYVCWSLKCLCALKRTHLIAAPQKVVIKPCFFEVRTDIRNATLMAMLSMLLFILIDIGWQVVKYSQNTFVC